jgi:hypothetical protein
MKQAADKKSAEAKPSSRSSSSKAGEHSQPASKAVDAAASSAELESLKGEVQQLQRERAGLAVQAKEERMKLQVCLPHSVYFRVVHPSTMMRAATA